MMMEYISEEEDNKENKEENKESTHANASGISLAVRPLSRKYSLILPILLRFFRSRTRGSRQGVEISFRGCLSVLSFFFSRFKL